MTPEEKLANHIECGCTDDVWCNYHYDIEREKTLHYHDLADEYIEYIERFCEAAGGHDHNGSYENGACFNNVFQAIYDRDKLIKERK